MNHDRNARTSRRRFLTASLAATGATTLVRTRVRAGEQPALKVIDDQIIDTNAYISHWPFRRLPADEPAALCEKLRARNVVQAWAGSFDGLFHKDLAAVNARLAETCRKSGGLLVPFGSVNPTQPDWREDLRRCQEEFGMPGIRVHPAYQGYGLDHPAFRELLAEADKCGLIVQLVAWMEDPRQQSALMRVPEVDLSPLAEQLDQRPNLRVVLLNGFTTPIVPALRSLWNAKQVWFDIARLDLLDGLNRMRDHARPDRILFGSYTPMFTFESSSLKLVESGLEGEPARAILSKNARDLLLRNG